MKANNKLQESITLQRRVIAGYEQTISENKTRRAYFIALNDYKQAAKIEQIISRDEQDLNKLKQQLNEMETELNATDNTPSTMDANEARTKSINGIMNQANRLMSVCNAVQNFKRADAIRAIAFRYYDNIRAYVGRFNYNDDSEYNKEYSRAQYMNA